MTERFMSIYETEAAFVCPTCGDAVDPDRADTLEAIEVGRGADERDEGVAVYFHDDCFPYASRRYELA
jgi:hypothetical protein